MIFCRRYTADPSSKDDMSLSKRLLNGLMAGGAGTAVLNIVTYLDMAIRGRPSSDVPAKVVDELSRKSGISLEELSAGQDQTTNRRSALGALMGFTSGLMWGALYGVTAPVLRDIASPVARSAGLGVAVMASNDIPAIAMGATDPTEWGLRGWMADVVPHLAYGLGTVYCYEALDGAR